MGRLDEIVAFVDENKIIADIGSDHGITAIKIYEEKNPKKVIATDISESSLQKLRDKIKYNNYDIETKVTDGLKGLSDDIEQIIISGMGGLLIAKILFDNLAISTKAEKLILSPNSSQEDLRHLLLENGFEIFGDKMIEENGIFYDIIISRYTGKVQKYEDKNYYIYGKFNIINKNSSMKKLIKNDIKNYKNVLKKLENLNTREVNQRKKTLKEEIEEKEKLLCRLEKY